jgi:hypothetical protein
MDTTSTKVLFFKNMFIQKLTCEIDSQMLEKLLKL